LSYTRDSAGNTIKRTGPTGSDTYTFDRTNQLTSATYASGAAEVFQYDPAGNRQAVTRASRFSTGFGTPSRKTSAYVTNEMNQYVAVGPSTMRYDDDGNLISDGRFHYSYDAENALAQVTSADGRIVRYTYDALGRLASRTDSRGTVHFLWDGNDIAIEESENQSPIATYTWSSVDEPLSMIRSGSSFFYTQDAAANVTEMTDAAGAVMERYSYDAFGEPTSGSQFGNPWMYASTRFDSFTGLHYMRARWYSSTLGRFVQPDPAGVEGGINAYSYVENSPLDNIDPFGQGFFNSIKHAFGAVGSFFNRSPIRKVLKVITLIVEVPVIINAWETAIGTAVAGIEFNIPLLQVAAIAEGYGAYNLTTNWINGWSRLDDQSAEKSVLLLAGNSFCHGNSEACGKLDNVFGAASNQSGTPPPSPLPTDPELVLDAASSTSSHVVMLGSRFTANGTATIHIAHPVCGERVYTVPQMDASGGIKFTYDFGGCCFGSYNGWAVDTATDRVSNVVSFNFAPSGPVWPVFHHDPQHTGRSPFVGAQVPALQWSYTAQGLAPVASSAIIGNDGTIYFGSGSLTLHGGYLNALSAAGKLLWAFAASDAVSPPAIGSDGTIYFGSGDKLYALTSSGEFKWSFTADGFIDTAPTLAPDGTIYVGTNPGTLYAVTSNGSFKWSFHQPGNFASTPAVGSDGTVYIGSNFSFVHALTASGTLKWSFRTLGSVSASPAIGSDGTIYVGSWGGILYALTPSGALRWSARADGPFESSPAIGSDGTIYVGSDDGYLYAVTADGRAKWAASTGAPVQSSPAIGADGTVYFLSNNGIVYAATASGTAKWALRIADPLPSNHGSLSSPTIGRDGTIYVGFADGNTYAVGVPVFTCQ
jgi:RHS repeat-associated protein